jgi:hypothetical protein
MMKSLNKRLNRKKASKVTLKNHRRKSHPGMHDEMIKDSEDLTSIRPEDIKFHQQY